MLKFEQFISALTKINMTNIIVWSILFTWFLGYNFGVFYKHDLSASQVKSLEKLDVLMNIILGYYLKNIVTDVTNELSKCNTCGKELND